MAFQQGWLGPKIIKTPHSGPPDAKGRREISTRSLRAGSKEIRSIPAPQPPGLFWAGPSGCDRVRFKAQIQKGLSKERPFFCFEAQIKSAKREDFGIADNAGLILAAVLYEDHDRVGTVI